MGSSHNGQPGQPWLAVLGGFHGEETLGLAVVKQLRGQPDIAGIVAHPKAVAQGRRFLGNGELGRHFPADSSSTNPEHQAASMLTQCLRRLPPDHLVLDIHNTTNPACDFVDVGKVTQTVALAAAQIMGRTVCETADQYPFYREFPQVMLVENSVPTPSVEPTTVKTVSEQIMSVATLGLTGLRAFYEEHGIGALKFYRHIVAPPIIHPDGSPNVPLRDELEAIEAGTGYDTVTISVRTASLLDIEPGEYISKVWQYHNMSPLRPDLGHTANGTPRREFIGCLLREAKPPRDIGNGWLSFSAP